MLGNSESLKASTQEIGNHNKNITIGNGAEIFCRNHFFFHLLSDHSELDCEDLSSAESVFTINLGVLIVPTINLGEYVREFSMQVEPRKYWKPVRAAKLHSSLS